MTLKKGKKIGCILLSAIMLFSLCGGLAIDTDTAYAESSPKADNTNNSYDDIMKTDMPEDYDEDSTVNPYTNNHKKFLIKEENELMVNMSWDNDNSSKASMNIGILDGYTLGKNMMIRPSKIDPESWLQQDWITKNSSNEKQFGPALNYQQGIGFDPNGTGRKDHVAFVGWDNNNHNYLWIYDVVNKVYCTKVELPGTFKIKNDGSVTYLNAPALYTITAGDYNDDGRDTIVVYNPADGNDFGVLEFSYKDKKLTQMASSKQMLHSLYCSNSKLYSDDSLQNRLGCHLTTGDFDGDGVDDLGVISYGQTYKKTGVTLSDHRYYEPMVAAVFGENKSEQGAVSNWSVVKNGSTKTTYVSITGDVGKDESNYISMRSPSISAGDIDGDGVDELVCAGYSSKIKVKEKNANYDGNDGFIKTQMTVGAIEVSRKNLDCQACVKETNKWSQYVAPVNVHVQLATECASLSGRGTAETVFINGSFYQYSKTSGKVDFAHVYTASIFNEKPKESELNSLAMTDVVVGNFTSDAEGREQVMFAVSEKERKSVGNDDIYLNYGSMYCKEDGNYYHNILPPRDGSVDASIKNKGDHTEQKLNGCMVTVDSDKDGILAEYSSKEYVYNDPKVAAVIQAGPLFGDVDEAGGYDDPCETSYSLSTSYEVGSSSSDSVSFGTGFASEVETSLAGFTAAVDLKIGYSLEWNNSFEQAASETYTTAFAAQTQDQVIISRIPVTVYKYYVYDDNGKKVVDKNGKAIEDAYAVSIPGKPRYYQLSIDEYNAFVDEYNKKISSLANATKLKKICKGELNASGKYDLPGDSEGNPQNYFTDWREIGDATTLSHNTLTLSYSGGSSTSEWNKSESSTKATEMSHGFDFELTMMAGGGVFGNNARFGGYASLDYMNSTGKFETHTKESGASGTVQNINEDAMKADGYEKESIRAYSFDWEFGTWKRKLTTANGTLDYTPFFGYRVWNVTMPIQAPENLEVDHSQTDGYHSVELTWDAVDSEALKGYNVYVLDGDDYIKLNDELVTDTNYTVSDLDTNTDYTFVVTAAGYLIETSGSINHSKTVNSLRSNTAEIRTPRWGYKVTLSSDKGSVITARNSEKEIKSGDEIFEGDAVSIEAKAKNGYTITKILLKKAGEEVQDITSTDGTFSFVVKGDTEVVVASKKNIDESEIRYSAEGKGSISATSDGQSFKSGALVSADVTLKAQADDGYVLKEWQLKTGNDTQVIAANGNNTYTFGPFAAKHEVKAVFVDCKDPAVVRTIKIDQATVGGNIEVSDSKGNVLTPDADGKLTVNVGTSVTITAKAKPHYVLNAWKGDFANVSKENTVIEHVVFEDFTVGADFYAPVKYKVSYGVNNKNYGQIVEDTIKSGNNYPEDTEMTFKATPKDGYRLECWKVVKGEDTSTIETKELKTEYELKLKVEDTTTVTACFKEKEKYHLRVVASQAGVIKVSDQAGNQLKDGDSITYGDKLTVTAEPKQYHELEALKVNGKTVANGSETIAYSDVSVEADYLRLLTQDGKVLPDVTANLAFSKAKYTGEAIEPDVTVTVDGKVLDAGTDYDVTYKDNQEPGTATVTIEGKGFYKGTLTETFVILERFTLSVAQSEFGSIKVVDQDDKELRSGDFIYEDDILTVTAEPKPYHELVELKVNGKSVENGLELTVDQNIVAEADYLRLLAQDGKALPDVMVTLAYSSTKYVGTSLKPAVTVIVDGKMLTAEDYRVSYTNNKNPGTATVTIKGKGVYKGLLKTTFKITENKEFEKTEVSKSAKVSVGSDKLSLKWGKVKRADGYDVFLTECSTAFAKKASVTTKKTSISVSKVKGKKISSKGKYKAIVKAYRMENGKKRYIAVSDTYHVVGSKSSSTNPKSITGTPAAKTLKVGKTYKIKATVNKVNKNKPLLSKNHAPVLRYQSSNSAVANVSSSGKITAKGQGTCTITVTAINGISKTIKVTVK